jgi:hypothetical protein
MTTCPLCGDETPVLYQALDKEGCALCARVYAGWDDTEDSALILALIERADAVKPPGALA